MSCHQLSFNVKILSNLFFISIKFTAFKIGFFGVLKHFLLPKRMEDYEEIKKLLEENNQAHVLKYWNELSEEQQKEFLLHLKSFNFKDACMLWDKIQENEKTDKEDNNDILPVEAQVEKDFSNDDIEEYRTVGLEEIGNGKVAVIVLAGGQGTRLGMSYPKGMCPTGIPSGKTLFQLQAERILRLQEIVKERIGKESIIYWYFMTSEPTHMLTEKFLEQNQYFKLKKENVKLFKQGLVPCFDMEGKFILEEKDGIALSPDGNGGLYKALKQHGILDDMDEKGIKFVHVHSVDNILIKVADPVFIGKCIKDKVDCGFKVIKKIDPNEPLGVVVRVNNKLKVVEYSELPINMATLEHPSGNGLLFNSGNICNHFFTVDFLKLIVDEHEKDLKVHRANKIITQIGPDGDKIRPIQPNCIKVEKFIFDVISYSQNFLAWQTERVEEFSPIKNSDLSKKDCFNTAKIDLLSLHKSWVEKKGGICKGIGLEVSPLASYGGEGLEFVKGKEFCEEDVIFSKAEKQNS
ncbi:UDP-N-acetylhexosamine pyrophosphorylase-like [Sitophilus oryzae]|uniref:UDP-N-acetylglucosamine diphosphorylase n=1 Tax=Sitophilus oryzae TaxID=7048 RepID=A0A6J2X7Y8_SITOR|nr:UDP-N-acetylhexosamine pyrophosphorylase-like [Sitophilus oryzae]